MRNFATRRSKKLLRRPRLKLGSPVIASVSEAIQSHTVKMDCFVALLLAMTTEVPKSADSHFKQPRQVSAIPRRDAPEFCSEFPPSPIRGRGECRAPDAPDSRVCDGRKQKAHALVRSHRNHPAFPTQWF
jgi:hypothetical protein